VDSKPVGRIVVEVDPAAGVGARRFLDLSVGVDGVGYRRTKIELIQDSYVQVGLFIFFACCSAHTDGREHHMQSN
jgi:hypothetical protein